MFQRILSDVFAFAQHLSLGAIFQGSRSIAESIRRDPLQGASAVVSIVGAIIFLVRLVLARRRRTNLSYLRSNAVLVDEATSTLQGLQVSLAGKVVKSLSVTTVAFWNAGKRTITPDLVPAKGALRFRVRSKIQILHAVVVADNCGACSFHGEFDGADYVVRFDSIPPNRGAFIQVLHTSTAAFRDTDFEATFLDGSVRSTNVGLVSSTLANIMTLAGTLIAGLSFVVLAVNGIANVFGDWSIPYTRNYVGAAFVLGLFLIALSLLLERNQSRRFAMPLSLKRLDPDGPDFDKLALGLGRESVRAASMPFARRYLARVG